MGVHNLWERLKPIAEVGVLENFCMSEGVQKVGRPLVIGIDISLWLFAVQSLFHVNHVGAGPEPELRTLFFKLALLMSLPIVPVFLFDGPKRPSIKRGKKVIQKDKKDNWLEKRVKDFIVAHGLSWYTAAGEAEAELAYLNYNGQIDIVLTDDSDAFVFGAQIVMRILTRAQKQSIGAKCSENIIYVYRSEAIAKNPRFGFSRDDFILIALLLGGDYNKEGLRGCGPTCAFAAAKYGLGAALLQAARLPDCEVHMAVASWRDHLRTLFLTDPKGHIGSKRCKLAADIPDSFPSLETLRLYASPAVTQFPDIIISQSRTDPDLGRLSFLCEQRFGFGKDLLSVSRHLFPGVLMSVLLEGEAASAAVVFARPSQIRIRRWEKRDGFLQAEVEIDIKEFIRELNAGREDKLCAAELQDVVDHSRPWKGWVPNLVLSKYLSSYGGTGVILQSPALAGSSIPLQIARSRPPCTGSSARDCSPDCPVIDLSSDSDSDSEGDNGSTSSQPVYIDLSV